MTTYHLEAAIAELHASAATLADTDWNAIVKLYDTLLSIAPSAVVALESRDRRRAVPRPRRRDRRDPRDRGDGATRGLSFFRGGTR